MVMVHVRHLRAVALVLVTTGLCGASIMAQGAASHRVVFEVTSADPQAWEGVLNNIENVQRALGVDVTEVKAVAHGKGIGLVMKADGKLAQRIAALTTKRVTFVACENTMKRLNIQKDDLLDVGTVDSGVAEVVRLQKRDGRTSSRARSVTALRFERADGSGSRDTLEE